MLAISLLYPSVTQKNSLKWNNNWLDPQQNHNRPPAENPCTKLTLGLFSMLQEHIEPTKSNTFTSAVRILIMQGACLDNGSSFYYLLEARLIIFPLIRFASPRREPASPDAQISFAVVCLSGPLHGTTKKQTTQITSDHEKQRKHLTENAPETRAVDDTHTHTHFGRFGLISSSSSLMHFNMIYTDEKYTHLKWDRLQI